VASVPPGVAHRPQRVSLPDAAAAGDWRARETLLRCYQQPDATTMLNLVMGGQELSRLKA
jgi:hypothetical protein